MPFQWIPLGQETELHGYKTSGGFYIASTTDKWSGEPSTITLNNSVGDPALPNIFSGSYYPSYLQLFASERGSYIKWIADGFSDESPKQRNLGYIFLYFYGI